MRTPATSRSTFVELLTDLGGAAADLRIGVALLIDEMQELATEEIAALAAACHEASQRNLPVTLVAAGLPNLPSALAEAKTYAERLFSYREVGALARDEARRALSVPAEHLGVLWTEDALEIVLAASAGYPYFLQAHGKAVWDYAEGPSIRSEDAVVGVEVMRRELELGFYGSRWDRATPLQQAYLGAVAEDGDAPSATAVVARRLGRAPRTLSVTRDQLLRKGLLYAPERGAVAFTVPGMADFIRRAT